MKIGLAVLEISRPKKIKIHITLSSVGRQIQKWSPSQDSSLCWKGSVKHMRFKPRMKESAKGKIVIFLKFLTQAELCDPYCLSVCLEAVHSLTDVDQTR